jgi:hypothetical protein
VVFFFLAGGDGVKDRLSPRRNAHVVCGQRNPLNPRRNAHVVRGQRLPNNRDL